MKSALIFPGYGNQYVGMGKELYDEYRIVQEYFEEASSCTDINFVKLCFASSDAELSKLAHAYMSLFLIGTSVAALLKEQGIVPDVVAGYNNGEMTALCAAGSFSLPDGLYLLNKFCSFYQESLDAMDITVARITGKTAQNINSIINEINNSDNKIDIAFYNSEKDCIVVGSSDAIGQLHTTLEANDGVVIDYLSPEIGLHSSAMNETIDQFKIYLEKVDFKNVAIPMISGIDGRVIIEGADIKERFIRHFVEPFHFNAVLDALRPYDLIIISTPALTLGKMIKAYYPEKNIVTIEKKADIEALKELVNTTAHSTQE